MLVMQSPSPLGTELAGQDGVMRETQRVPSKMVSSGQAGEWPEVQSSPFKVALSSSHLGLWVVEMQLVPSKVKPSSHWGRERLTQRPDSYLVSGGQLTWTEEMQFSPERIRPGGHWGFSIMVQVAPSRM